MYLYKIKVLVVLIVNKTRHLILHVNMYMFTNNGMPLLLDLAPGIFIFWKVLYFLAKITCYISCIAHTFHINVILYTKKLMVGVPSLIPIPVDI